MQRKPRDFGQLGKRLWRDELDIIDEPDFSVENGGGHDRLP